MKVTIKRCIWEVRLQLLSADLRKGVNTPAKIFPSGAEQRKMPR
jgi:hypothetical protein